MAKAKISKTSNMQKKNKKDSETKIGGDNMGAAKNLDPNTGSNTGNKPATSFIIGKFFVKKMELDGTAALDAENTTSSNENSRSSNLNPEVKIEFSLNHNALKNDTYEVDLTIKANATLNGKPFFLASIQQAGFFTAKNFNSQQIDFILNGYCPAMLFPYARENIANIIQRGGFKTLDLPAIDFIAVYQKQLQERDSKK